MQGGRTAAAGTMGVLEPGWGGQGWGRKRGRAAVREGEQRRGRAVEWEVRLHSKVGGPWTHYEEGAGMGLLTQEEGLGCRREEQQLNRGH